MVPEQPSNKWQPLEAGPDITKQHFYIGTSGYYYDDWIGLFNPPKMSAKAAKNASEEERKNQDRLQFYQKYFSFVEINHTFYQEPVPGHFYDIEKRSKPGMLYAVKVYKDISHSKSFDTEAGKELMRRHIAAMAPLVETGRFYSFLIQLEDHLYRTTERLDYLLAVASEAVKMYLDVHIEFRHNSWHTRQTLQSLKDSGVGICNTDLPPIKHVFPLRDYATTDKGYLRYNGRNLANWYPPAKQMTPKERFAARNARYDYLYSPAEMAELVKGQLNLSGKTSKLAIAFNNHYKIKAIINAIMNAKMLKEKLASFLKG
ncbi:MAG: DUF72 domain-containing protein [Chitinispirillaceae bacterium]|jgi:uncharacterized protein YecE (DUF72 family)